jgi:hypothetical protein
MLVNSVIKQFLSWKNSCPWIQKRDWQVITFNKRLGEEALHHPYFDEIAEKLGDWKPEDRIPRFRMESSRSKSGLKPGFNPNNKKNS